MTKAAKERLVWNEIFERTVDALETVWILVLYWTFRIIVPLFLFLVLIVSPLAAYYFMFGGN